MAKYIPANNIIGTNLVPNDITIADDLLIEDLGIIKVGTGGDLQIYHDGTDSWIENTTVGDLYIGNNGNGKDVIIVCDDGSGAITPYITLDGSATSVSIGQAVTMSSTLTVASEILHLGDLDNKIGFTTDTQTFTTGGSSRLTISNSGSTFAGNVTAPNLIIDDDGQIGSASANSAMEIDDQGVVGFNGGITAAGNVKSTIKTRVGALSNNTDGDYKMGDVVYFGSTTSMTAGSVYVYSGTAWELANAGAASTAIGMLAVALGAASDTNGMLLRGMVTLSADPGSVSEPLYLSTTGGRAQNSAPAGSGKVVRLIGYCLDSTNGQIYFNPDNHHTVL